MTPATTVITTMPPTVQAAPLVFPVVATPAPAAPVNVLVPVSHPAHPSHISWLRIMLSVLEAATSIGPAVVAIADPEHAKLAAGLGQVAAATEANIEEGIAAQQ